MASRTSSIPTRAVKRSERPAHRGGVQGAPARSAISPAAQQPRQHERSSPSSSGTGFTIRLSGEPTPSSGTRPSNSSTTPQKSHSAKEHSSVQHHPAVTRTAANNAAQRQVEEVPEKSHSATKPTQNKRLSAQKGSKIPKPSPGKHRLTNTELKGILAVVDKLNEEPEESAEKKKKYDDDHTIMSPSQLNLRATETTAATYPGSANNIDVGHREDLLDSEETWRHGDVDTGELGLGGISRQDRARRAGQPRTRNESPADLDALISQIGTEKNITGSPTPKKKDQHFNTDDNDIADLMELTEGYEEMVSPKSSLSRSKPNAASRNKIAKGDMDQLLGMIESEHTSAPKREASDRKEVVEGTRFVDTWRTGDGDQEVMNRLRTKPRDRDAPSQSPDWSLEDLITNRHPSAARHSREDSPIRGRRDVSVESGNNFSDDEIANSKERERPRSTSKDTARGLSDFDSFIDSSILSTPVRTKSPEASHRDDNWSVARPKQVPSSEKPLLSSRVSNVASAAPPRNTRSRSPVDGRRQFGDPKSRPQIEHVEDAPAFFNDIIIPKRSLESASTVPSRQKTRPPPPAVKPKPKPASEAHQGHSRAMDSYQPNSHTNTREHSKPVGSRKGDDRVSPPSTKSSTKRQSGSSSKASKGSQEKSRSVRPLKSKTPEKSSSISQPKSRSTSPSKSRSTSPSKSRSTSPIKSDAQYSPGSADRGKSPSGGIPGSNRKKHSPSRWSPQIEDYRGGHRPVQSFEDHLSSSNDKNRHNSRRVDPDQKYSSHTSPTKSSPAQATTTRTWEQDVVYRSKPEDKTDAKPKRKSLSLAGMSNPYRDDSYGLQLRNLIHSTEALEKQMFSLMKPSK